MKKIAIITRDCAGVNAVIRSIVRTASKIDIEVFGFIKGFEGLIDGIMVPLDNHSVSGIINLGGTILKTARSKRFLYDISQQQAVKTLKINHIDGLIIVGGDGSLKGAHTLAKQYNIKVIGVPATIDNDINGVNLSIGTDTAINVALDALDKIRDTATSLERIFVVEVMGNKSGYIALQVALAGGCEEVLIPEMNFNINTICSKIKEGEENGKQSWIIIVAEGKAKAHDIAMQITSKTGFETRVTVLGHIQRGGRPTVTDRIMATQLGNYAVKILNKNITDQCVHINNGRLGVVKLEKAISPKKLMVTPFYKLLKDMI